MKLLDRVLVIGLCALMVVVIHIADRLDRKSFPPAKAVPTKQTEYPDPLPCCHRMRWSHCFPCGVDC